MVIVPSVTARSPLGATSASSAFHVTVVPAGAGPPTPAATAAGPKRNSASVGAPACAASGAEYASKAAGRLVACAASQNARSTSLISATSRRCAAASSVGRPAAGSAGARSSSDTGPAPRGTRLYAATRHPAGPATQYETYLPGSVAPSAPVTVM